MEDNASLVMIVGELRGQQRELIHNVNNLRQEVQSLATQKSVTALEAQIAKIQATENQRIGAVTLGAHIIRSPLLAWLGTLVIAAWALLSGKTVQ